jgi:hypothetical protein
MDRASAIVAYRTRRCAPNPTLSSSLLLESAILAVEAIPGARRERIRAEAFCRILVHGAAARKNTNWHDSFAGPFPFLFVMTESTPFFPDSAGQGERLRFCKNFNHHLLAEIPKPALR